LFKGLMNQAKDALGGLVLKYVARASVAIPFVIARWASLLLPSRSCSCKASAK